MFDNRLEEHPLKEGAEPRLTDSPELPDNRTSIDKREEIPAPVSVLTTLERCADTTGLSRPRGETPPALVVNNTPRMSHVELRTDSDPDALPVPETATD